MNLKTEIKKNIENELNPNSFKDYQLCVSAYLNNKIKSTKDLLKFKGLSYNESRLILARIYLKNENFKNALEELNKINSSLIFLEAEKNKLLANLAFYTGEFQKSALHNLIALNYYSQISFQRGVFFSAYNLSIDYSSLQLNELSDHYLRIAKLNSVDAHTECLVLREELVLMNKLKNKNKVLEISELLESRLRQLSLTDRIGTLSILAESLISINEINSANRILNLFKKTPKTRERIRFLFLKQVVKVLLNNKPIEKVPFLLDKSSNNNEFLLLWKSLYLLQEGHQDEALKYWKKLSEASPGRFMDSFRFNGGFYSPAQHLLNKIQNQSNEKAIATYKVPINSLCGRVYSFLKEAIGPQRKEDIIESCWMTSYHPNLDARFYKIIERLKSEYGCKVINVRRAYKLLID